MTQVLGQSGHCAICGNLVIAKIIHRELNTCRSCGSNTRFRATILALMQGLGIGECNLSTLAPVKALKGIGISDSPSYAGLLAEKFNYTNTYYHCEPFLNIEKAEDFMGYKPLDFIICNDVIEHTLLPPIHVIRNIYEALGPSGTLVLCAPTYRIECHIEKYPSLASFEVENYGDGFKINYTTKTGSVGEDLSPIFHGGPGRVLELRILSQDYMIRDLELAGFQVEMVDDFILNQYAAFWPERSERPDIPEAAVGKPLICKKVPK